MPGTHTNARKCTHTDARHSHTHARLHTHMHAHTRMDALHTVKRRTHMTHTCEVKQAVDPTRRKAVSVASRD